MNVRAATPEDVETVGLLLDDATAWVGQLGFRQWPVPFPRDEIAAAIERGEVYVADIDGESVATVTLLESDPFWGERPPDALYVHKLAVRRDRAGQGIGAALLDWAADRAARGGRSFLRLDCLSADPGIRRYYESLGFKDRGEFHDRGRGFQLRLYERTML